MSDCDVLIEKIRKYNPDVDTGVIKKAAAFAKKKHEGQTRSSGKPYYTHPMAVAKILAGMNMDVTTIVTAILHDTLEDTDTTYEELASEFGEDVASLVEGVSKLTKIEEQSVEGKQAENFRKLLIAISKDIRVLLVKLADRIHNMRTIRYHKSEEKRRRISRETLEIYAPLAERIGVNKIKVELEGLAFAQINPEARESISKRLSYLRKEGEDVVASIIEELKKHLDEAGIKAEVNGREKTKYSIWKKMQRKNVSFEQLSDIMAFRVLVDDVGECYHALGIIHSHYPTVPGRFKDYISTPKPNGYRSIHTTVIGPGNHRIEIQIRTREMHEEAELGVAAHWAYKDGLGAATQKDAKNYRWLRELLEILDGEQKPEEFLENTKLELFQEQVFVFTPQGDLIELPNGATPVDFAYAIHSGVGDRCIGAKVNGKIAPLNSKLNNGDQVDIITSRRQTPSPTWERFVVTGKARSRIRRFIRQQQREEFIALGRSMLKKIFQQEGYTYKDNVLEGIIKKMRVDSVEDILANIGSGHFAVREVFRKIFPGHKTKLVKQKKKPAGDIALVPREGSNSPVPIKGLVPGMAVHFARCCHPLPGDKIVGIVTTGKGVTVHTIDCETLETFADTPERWIDVSWGESEESEAHVGRLSITNYNEPGALAAISTVIGKNGGDITNFKIVHRTMDFWEILMDVYVNDTKHLNDIIAALRATPEVASVDRTKGR